MLRILCFVLSLTFAICEEIKGNVLFRFTSKSCGICERFSKEWEKVVRDSDPKLTRTIDCDKNTKFCLQQDIRSYPTFKVHSKYEGFIDYYGPTDRKALKAFIKSLSKKDCYSTNTCSDEFHEWLDSEPDLSLTKAMKELKNVNRQFTKFFQNITSHILKYKNIAYEKVDYIYNYENE